MTVSERAVGSVTFIDIEGQLTLGDGADRLQDKVRSLLLQNQKQLIVNLAGVDFANFLIANVLVGIGWNFAYVGGSTLLTTTYTPAERAKAQASHDFAVYAATATAAALSGVLAAKAGWTVINLAALPLMAAVTGAAAWLMLHQRRAQAAAAAE